MPRPTALPFATFALALVFALMPTPAPAVEEPRYELVRQLDERVELRRYAPYVVAEVVLDVSGTEAGNQAFPILAGYIFGKNKGQRKLAMTAPVTQSAEPAAPMKMAMTAPVIQSAAAGGTGMQGAAAGGTGMQTAAAGGTRVQFVLPADITLATAPEPLDARVRLREEPATTWAAIRYSGTWSQANFDEHLAALQASLARAGLAGSGDPVWARYNGPWTPWFMRRNEIWLAVK